jgi:hypothetical protein
MQGLSRAVRLCYVQNDGEGSNSDNDSTSNDSTFINNRSYTGNNTGGVLNQVNGKSYDLSRDRLAHIHACTPISAPSISLLDEYLDEIIPALLIRTVSRRAQNEEVVVDQAFLVALTEGINGQVSIFHQNDF